MTNTLPEPIRIWVEALESGTYKQTRLHLGDATGRCCLGVACEVYREHVDQDFGYDPEGTVLPKKVKEWLGLASRWGSYDNHESLAALNDSFEMSFEEIADVIRGLPAGLLAKDE